MNFKDGGEPSITPLMAYGRGKACRSLVGECGSSLDGHEAIAMCGVGMTAGFILLYIFTSRDERI